MGGLASVQRVGLSNQMKFRYSIGNDIDRLKILFIEFIVLSETTVLNNKIKLRITLKKNVQILFFNLS